ncbi:MAG: dihydrofolate reductase [Saprospiraceae bacterium]|nr:dihydrofolate reductase [Saprospiraceae bacterium]MCB0676543.1 dihydrofolate reductase [Saprospiraceae bacterium]
MRKIRLYIAISLDGWIAKPDGDVAWLDQIPTPEGEDYGYAEFYAGIDTTLMGFNTYREVLGFGIPFPYPDKTNYVFTRQTDQADTEHVKFITADPATFLRELRTGPGADIWLIGGGQLNSALLQHDLIDEMWVFVMPIVLGHGIPLFAPPLPEKQLTLLHHQTYPSGVTLLKYEPRS